MTTVKLSVRLAVLNRDRWLCMMPVCLHPDGRDISQEPMSPDDPWAPTVDHKVQRSQGGSGRQENLRAAHRECNQKGAPHSLMARSRASRPLTYRIGDLFPGDQGSAWS